MKPYHCIIIFAALVLSAALASMKSYRCTESYILSDMNQALLTTLHDTQDQWITPDTIRSYRANLKIEGLRDKNIISYVMRDEDKWHATKTSGMLATKMMTLQGNTVQGLANCSMLDIFGMSNQRLPMGLSMLAMVWAIGSMLYFRKRHSAVMLTDIGEMTYDELSGIFYNHQNKEVKFTPMQHQLMQMFWQNDHHILTKQEICDRLWPKKPDANETLYTLIRRIKPIIESNSTLKIESDRGKSYRLVNKQDTELLD
jgi:hypothetical protein